MAKVITFSRTFPAYHPKAGQPTYFVEKVVKSMHLSGIRPWDIDDKIFNEGIYYMCSPKHHTIRAGHRFKAGDWFSPRVWGDNVNPKSGRKGPYNSDQIIIAPDIQVKKTWDFEIYTEETVTYFVLDKKPIFMRGLVYENHCGTDTMSRAATNDGLNIQDMFDWFTLSPEFKKTKRFDGQIICWNESINY